MTAVPIRPNSRRARTNRSCCCIRWRSKSPTRADTEESSSAARIRAQRTTSSSSVIVTFRSRLMTRLSCYTKVVSNGWRRIGMLAEATSG